MQRIAFVAGAAVLAVALTGSAEAQVPFFVSVDCDAGESIQAVLEKTIDEHQLVVSVSGTCREGVQLRRDDVALQGQAGATIIADPNQGYAVYVNRGRRVSLSNLTLVGGYQAALLVVSGEVTGEKLTLREGNGGIVCRGGTVMLSDSSVFHSAFSGVTVEDGTVSLAFCTIAKNRTFGISAFHARADLFDVEISDNMTGVAADTLAVVSTAGHYVRIHDNQLGVRLKRASLGSHNGVLPTVSHNVTDFDVDATSVW